MIRCFVGVDRRNPVAYSVTQMSLVLNSSKPVSVTPLLLDQLPMTRQGLTSFTYDRFLVPHLCDYEGQAIFMDSDVLVRGDIDELWDRDYNDPVSVVKNARRFEWPSVMVFNCRKCEVLTPDFVQTSKNPLNLDWADSIGELPSEWNHLAGYDAPNPDAKLVHFTQGLPCYPEHPNLWNAEHGQEWRDMAKLCMTTQKWEALMGSSVHAQHVLKGDNRVTC